MARKFEFKRFIGLSLELARAGFKLRNEGSYLGILWYLINPLLMFSLLLLVFSDRIGGGIDHYPLYLLLGIIMFNFFSKATLESTKIFLHENRWIVKSINFPREALVGGIILRMIFSHFFEIALFTVFLLFFNLSIIGILYYLLLLVLFCIFVFGIGLLLSSIAVYVVDLENIWSFLSFLLWLGTPIFYTIGGQTKLFYANLLNPLYYFITIARDLTIYGKMPDLWIIGGALLFSLLSFFWGLIVFRKLKYRFAELI